MKEFWTLFSLTSRIHRRVFSRIFACFSQSKLLNMYDIDVPSHVCNLRVGERLFPHLLHVNDKVQPILNKRYKFTSLKWWDVANVDGLLSYYVTYEFQSKFTLYGCLNVKKVRGNQVRGNVGKASEEKSNSFYDKGTEQSSYDKIYD